MTDRGLPTNYHESDANIFVPTFVTSQAEILEDDELEAALKLNCFTGPTGIYNKFYYFL